jgi:hypothetical protein
MMAKVETKFAFGRWRVYYPECPYHGMVVFEDCECTSLQGSGGCCTDGTYYCSVANAHDRCPFDLHKEMYGEKK